MDEFTYNDFDLRFSKCNESYCCKFIDAGGASYQHIFERPFGEDEFNTYLLKIGERRRGVRGAGSPEATAARELGGRLFDAIFQGQLQNIFAEWLDGARSAETGLRIRLHLQDTPELADLPWEFLYDRQAQEFLGLSKETPIVRFFDLKGTQKALAISPPVRILVMISSPSNQFPLRVKQEWETLKEALKELEDRGLVVLERLKSATIEELQVRLQRENYHVFHFVGHGGFENDESGVLMENEDGQSEFVSGSKLAVFLRDEKTLRLALLNSCEGARASPNDPFSGAAQALIHAGLPAAIAMQFSVSDEAALAFSRGFYTALIGNYPIDAAVAEARKRVYAKIGTAEWGTPVLYLRAPTGRIFNIDTGNVPPKPSPEPPPPRPLPERPLHITKNVGRITPPEVAKVELGAPGYTHQVPIPSPLGPSIGMRITVPVKASHAAGKTLQLIARFSYTGGAWLSANAQEMIFRDTAGRIATATPPRVVQQPDEPSTEAWMTIPYYAFNFQPTNCFMSYNLSFVISAYLDNALAVESPPVGFGLRW